MKPALLKSFVATAALAILPTSLQLYGQNTKSGAGQIHYSVINLSTLGGTMSNGYGGPVRLFTQEGQETKQNPIYSVSVVPGLGGTQWSPFGITDTGAVTGDANLPGDQTEHGFIYQHGTVTDVGTLGGPNSGVCCPSHNNAGKYAGLAQTAVQDPYHEGFSGFVCNNQTGQACSGNFTNQGLPYVWQDGVMSPLPTLGGINGAATGVSANGLIAGALETTTRDPSCIPPQVFDVVAVFWDSESALHVLPTPVGDALAAAWGINSSGDVIGNSGPCGPVTTFALSIFVHPLFWEKGRAIKLATLGGASGNFPADINERGDVAGFSDLPGDTTTHAVLWRAGNHTLADLGTLEGDVSSFAFGINNHRQIVGQSCDANFNCRAFIWQHGHMMDLNALIPPGSPIYFVGGFAINDRGEIVGQGFDPKTGQSPGFLAIPCGEDDADAEGCDEAGSSAQLNSSPTVQVTLPENVRKLLQQRRGFGRFGAGLVKQQ